MCNVHVPALKFLHCYHSWLITTNQKPSEPYDIQHAIQGNNKFNIFESLKLSPLQSSLQQTIVSELLKL